MSRLTCLFGLLWVSAPTFAAGLGREVEATFVDPLTHKSGKYKTQFPDSATKPFGLLVFFHGSGGGPSYADHFEDLRRIAAINSLIPLAIQAPNGAETWPDTSPAMPLQHVAYVASLLDEIIFKPHPNLSRQKTVFVGVSAGSTFLSGDFLPKQIERYGGGAVLLCGGGAPLLPGRQLTSHLSEALIKSFKLVYYIQTGDFLLSQTKQGLHYWEHRGLSPVGTIAAGSGHCNFNVAAELEQGVKTILAP